MRQTRRQHTPAHRPARRRHTQNHPLASRRQTPVTCHWKNAGHLRTVPVQCKNTAQGEDKKFAVHSRHMSAHASPPPLPDAGRRKPNLPPHTGNKSGGALPNNKCAPAEEDRVGAAGRRRRVQAQPTPQATNLTPVPKPTTPCRILQWQSQRRWQSARALAVVLCGGCGGATREWRGMAVGRCLPCRAEGLVGHGVGGTRHPA